MTIRWAYLKRVLAGAIFGLYIAHLLYFLNPQVEITPLRLAIVTIVYGAICGLLFGTLLWLLRILRVKLFGKPEEVNGAYRAHGFGYVVLAAFNLPSWPNYNRRRHCRNRSLSCGATAL